MEEPAVAALASRLLAPSLRGALPLPRGCSGLAADLWGTALPPRAGCDLSRALHPSVLVCGLLFRDAVPERAVCAACDGLRSGAHSTRWPGERAQLQRDTAAPVGHTQPVLRASHGL